MSDAFAVAAVTETLRAVLQDAMDRTVSGAVVTLLPPDEVTAECGLNVFLYRTSLDAGWLNADPDGTRPGESRRPLLPLVLHYLLTPYAAGDAQGLAAHRILGAAMAALHDRPVLGPADLGAAAPFSNLHQQTEPVRIAPVTLDLADTVRLWTAFRSRLRPSVAYEARPVLIESTVPGRTPLPVVRRGEHDRGPEAAAALGRRPALAAATVPVALPGHDLVLTGHCLDSGVAALRLAHPLHGSHLVQEVRTVSDTEVHATLPEAVAAGTWSAVLVLVAADGTERTTEAVPVGVAPRLTGTLPLPVVRDADGTAVLEVTCGTPVHPGQRVELLVGEVPVPAEPFVRATSALRFRLAGARPGRYALRLRVDGVDSPLLDAASEQPRFDAAAAVVVT
ncbi:DUF4255 domain-containing protein [Kitasatospora purpeofusca]|uniref:DUF4255 domain-containing protein n=1 Tax=Kitasatospora purpeofusca TaxID=67352 RepID=UPI0035D9F12F